MSTYNIIITHSFIFIGISTTSSMYLTSVTALTSVTVFTSSDAVTSISMSSSVMMSHKTVDIISSVGVNSTGKANI